MKPYKLRRWRLADGISNYYFFTCARPGRTSRPESRWDRVEDAVVRQWLSGLPGPKTAIVSLLGCKPDGTSEYDFYSFYGGFDKPEEQSGRKSFREWLDQYQGVTPILLEEHPTEDFKRVSDEALTSTATIIRELMRDDYTVVLIDSGGEQRTGQVCRHIGAVEDSSRT